MENANAIPLSIKGSVFLKFAVIEELNKRIIGEIKCENEFGKKFSVPLISGV